MRVDVYLYEYSLGRALRNFNKPAVYVQKKGKKKYVPRTHTYIKTNTTSLCTKNTRLRVTNTHISQTQVFTFTYKSKTMTYVAKARIRLKSFTEKYLTGFEHIFDRNACISDTLMYQNAYLQPRKNNVLLQQEHPRTFMHKRKHINIHT